jgi:hypothetical protein
MKKCFLLAIGLIYSLASTAQKNGIYGVCALKDSKKELSGMEVNLLDSALQVLASTFTDANGNWGFVIEHAGKYFIQYNDGSGVKTIDPFDYTPTSSIKINLLVSNAIQLSPNSDRKVITAQEMEKLPPSQQNNSLTTRARYYSEKGVIKSASNGSAPVYYIDGQRVSNPALVPGSVDQIQILNH